MQSFKVIDFLVLEKKIIIVFAVYSHGDHLGPFAADLFLFAITAAGVVPCGCPDKTNPVQHS